MAVVAIEPSLVARVLSDPTRGLCLLCLVAITLLQPRTSGFGPKAKPRSGRSRGGNAPPAQPQPGNKREPQVTPLLFLQRPPLADASWYSAAFWFRLSSAWAPVKSSRRSARLSGLPLLYPHLPDPKHACYCTSISTSHLTQKAPICPGMTARSGKPCSTGSGSPSSSYARKFPCWRASSRPSTEE